MAELVQKRPDLPDAHRFLGVTLFALDRDEEALASLRRATELAPGDVDLSATLWGGLVLSDRFEEARTAVRPFSESPDPMKRSAGVLLPRPARRRAGRSRQSAELLGRAAEMVAPSRRAVVSLDAVRSTLPATSQGERSSGPSWRSARLGPLPLAENALYWKARSLAASGQHEEAARTAAELRRRTSGWPVPEARRRLLRLDADLLAARGDAEGAARGYAEVEELLPKLKRLGRFHGEFVLCRYGLAEALLAAGRYDEAARYFELVTTAKGGRLAYPELYVRSFFFLGQLAEKRGDAAAARRHYERFLFYWKDGDLDRDRVAEALRKSQ